MDSFPHTGDIVVNSFYDPATGEVAAFEELAVRMRLEESALTAEFPQYKRYAAHTPFNR